MLAQKMGGKERLRVFVKANEDVTDSLLSIRDSGRKVESGLRDLLQEKYQGRFAVEILCEPGGRSDLILQELEGPHLPAALHPQGQRTGAFRTRLREGSFDVVVLSVQPDVLFSSAKGLAAPEIEESLSLLIRALHKRCGAHVLIFNCSSVDPNDHIHNYHNREDTFAVRAHRVNLALMKVSQREGISIIDVERVVAELGGQRHVEQAGTYSPEACQAIGQEFLRVLADIGFFENRPLVPQVGQKEKARKAPEVGKGAS
jgi:hypothetical protein